MNKLNLAIKIKSKSVDIRFQIFANWRLIFLDIAQSASIMAPFRSIPGPKYKAPPLPVHPGHMTIHRKNIKGWQQRKVLVEGVRLDTPDWCTHTLGTYTCTHAGANNVHTWTHTTSKKWGVKGNPKFHKGELRQAGGANPGLLDTAHTMGKKGEWKKSVDLPSLLVH